MSAAGGTTGGGLTQRRRAGPPPLTSDGVDAATAAGYTEEDYSRMSPRTAEDPALGGSAGALGDGSGAANEGALHFDEDGFSAEDMAHGRKVKLTLMEEVLLLGLKDEQGYLSFWNDNISYVLRGCMLMELAMRNRIACFKEPAGRHLRKPFEERLVEVVDDTPTGEVLLDEALKIMKAEQSARADQRPPSRQTVADWVDLLSGETWNLLKVSYQMKQVRERLAKGLVDKGVLRTGKKNFLVFEMATHPISDPAIKSEVINRVVDCLLGRGPAPTRRTLALCCAAYAGNVIENALSAVAMTGGLHLSYSQKDACFAKCEEMLTEWAGVTIMNNENAGKTADAARSLLMRESIGWTDVMSGAVGVFLKMDSML